MPNWCYTSYKISGSRKAVKDLYERIMKLDCGEGEMLENGFGNLWLGNLVNGFAHDWKLIDCKGRIIEFFYNEELNLLTLDTETAWSACRETFDVIKEHYRLQGEKIDISFCEEECGNCIYTIHNEGDFTFNYKYCVDYSGKKTVDIDYAIDLIGVAYIFEKEFGVLGTDREKSEEENIKFMEDYAEQLAEETGKDYFFFIHEFDYE